MRKSRRILIVEDFKPFRLLLASWLTVQRESYEVFASSDGLDAVNQAIELKPDVITMDIGLPHLNGIEAARKIREALPEARILFVSEESSPDILEEVWSTGAAGYIHKSRASKDLLAGISTICDGKQADITALWNVASTGTSNSPANIAIATQSPS